MIWKGMAIPSSTLAIISPLFDPTSLILSCNIIRIGNNIDVMFNQTTWGVGWLRASGVFPGLPRAKVVSSLCSAIAFYCLFSVAPQKHVAFLTLKSELPQVPRA